MYKHFVHEGGISTPLIVHWPNVIKAKGECAGTPGHLIDVMATCIDVSGAKYPEKYKGNDILPMEGKSLVPAFTGQNIKRDALYWEHEKNCAIRIGNWKLVGKGLMRNNGPDIKKWELYNMDVDRSELNNLAKKAPRTSKGHAQKFHGLLQVGKSTALGKKN